MTIIAEFETSVVGRAGARSGLDKIGPILSLQARQIYTATIQNSGEKPPKKFQYPRTTFLKYSRKEKGNHAK